MEAYDMYNTTEVVASSTDVPTLDDTTSGIQCSQSLYECEVQRLLWMISGPIILLVGTVGNILIIAVMSHKSTRKTAFGTYLIAISVTDLLCIWTGLIRHIIKNYTKIDIRKEHQLICWLQRIILYGSANASVWLLAAVTLERTLSIYTPTRGMKLKSYTRTKLIISAIIFIQYGWCCHIFFSRGLEYSRDGNHTLVSVCGYPTEQSRWYYKNNVQTYIALVDYSILPFLAMFIMNMAIFLRLRKRDKAYTNCATVSKAKTTTDYEQQQPQPQNQQQHQQQHQQPTKRIKFSSKTLMLLPVTIFFLVTTLPSVVFTGIENTRSRGKESDLMRAQMEVVDFAVTSLMYLNHSLNFFLYCLTGKMFRRKCWLLLTRCYPCNSKSERDYRRTETILKQRFSSYTPTNSTGVSPYNTPPRPKRPNTFLRPKSANSLCVISNHDMCVIMP